MPDPRSRLLIIDGHSLAYRAFYAMPPLTTKRGEPVGAILGFTNMLLKAVEIEQPAAVACSFDRGRPVQRLEHFAEYKAGRDKMAETMHAQMPVIEELVSAFGIPIFTSEAHEADDCIGTLARRAEEQGFETVIISGDLDLLQLVTPHVRVMATIRGLAEMMRYDEAGVQERYGFSPALVPDFKALAGDASDNIPGVAGIGKGTATTLIQAFGPIESLLERVDDVPPRWRDKIREAADEVRTFKSLATIHTDLPLAVDWEACAWHGVPPSAADLLRRLEFFNILERLDLEGAGPAPAPPAVEPVTIHPVLDDAALDAAVAALRAAPATGLAWIRENGRVVAFAAASDGRSAFACPIAGPREGELFAAEGLEGAAVATRLGAALGDVAAPAWTFDWKAALVDWDLEALRGNPRLGDVGVASYLLESGESQKSLQAIATRHRRRVPPDVDAVLGKGAKAVAWETVGRERLLAFAAETAAATLDLAEFLRERLAAEGLDRLFHELEMPLAWVLARMEREGVALDADYLRTLAVEMERDLAEIQKDIHTLAGEPFNILSPKQMGEILFEKLCLPGGKKTKTGAYTTDADALLKLADDYPICRRILDYREIAKLKSTYVEALPRLIDARDGRLHTSWNATVAATGRLSSSEPNLQNIPIRSELGRRIRRAFVAAPGHLLVSADYSQIELRIMAHLAQDPQLVRVFSEGGDVHAATAAEIFRVPLEQVTSDQRRKAKEVNFGIMYGMGPEGLSNRIGVSRHEARDYIARYLDRFAGVRTFTEATIAAAREEGYVTTMLGRRRYLPEVRSQNRMVRAAAERMAINAPIQGSAADLIKRAMVALDADLRAGLPARMTMQVHDELVFEVAEADLERVAERVRASMEGALEMSVPLQVDLKAGPNWAETRPLPAAPLSEAGRAR